MQRSFEETKDRASEALCDMDHELAVLQRTHRNYIKHGAVNAAAELEEIIHDKEMEIESEECLFEQTFY